MWHFKIVRTAVMALVGYGLIVYWFVADRGPRIEISQALIFGVLLAAVETVMLVQRLRNTNWGGFSPLSRALGCLLCLAIGGLWLYSAGRTEAGDQLLHAAVRPEDGYELVQPRVGRRHDRGVRGRNASG